jgi:hypothetical protein
MHWIFAYGSNMHLGDLARWLRANGSAEALPARVAAARIEDYELAWNYRSVARAGGAANAKSRAGAALRGLALWGDDRMLAALDRKEGHPDRYDRGDHPIRATLLADGATIPSWLYRVAPAHELEAAVPPRRAYLELLIEAAAQHGLGADYVAHLRQIPTSDEGHAVGDQAP